MKLTPVEKHENIFIKRDDLFKPFKSISCGGKARQISLFLYINREDIKKHFHNTIIMQSDVNTISGVIAAEIAKYYNMKIMLCLGAAKESLLHKYQSMILAKSLGAKIRVVSKLGYASVIDARVREICLQEQYFNASYNVENALKYPEAFLNATALQTANLPRNLDNLVVPVGSGINFTGILLGLSRKKTPPKKIYGIRVGPDRTSDIKKLLNGKIVPDFELLPYSDKLDYSSPATEYVNSIALDPFYEAKAFQWMLKNIDPKQKNCFWIVGKHPA